MSAEVQEDDAEHTVRPELPEKPTGPVDPGDLLVKERLMIHYLRMDAKFSSDDPADSEDAFDVFTDRVFDELLNLQALDVGIVEPDLTVNLAARRISFLMGIEASTQDDAIKLFLANVRCALHAAECNTGGFPRYEPTLDAKPSIRRVEAADA
ncbi:hypothetical protein [Nonomuraea coxensis]|nr:hypothetical protein [Nonomuraea coxensis]